jgi:hypothetical protein
VLKTVVMVVVVVVVVRAGLLGTVAGHFLDSRRLRA